MLSMSMLFAIVIVVCFFLSFIDNNSKCDVRFGSERLKVNTHRSAQCAGVFQITESRCMRTFDSIELSVGRSAECVSVESFANDVHMNVCMRRNTHSFAHSKAIENAHNATAQGLNLSNYNVICSNWSLSNWLWAFLIHHFSIAVFGGSYTLILMVADRSQCMQTYHINLSGIKWNHISRWNRDHAFWTAFVGKLIATVKAWPLQQIGKHLKLSKWSKYKWAN